MSPSPPYLHSNAAPDPGQQGRWESFESGPLGQELSLTITEAVSNLVPQRYFKVGVQVGLRGGFFLERAEQQYLLLEKSDTQHPAPSIRIDTAESLPFGRHSVDLLILPFVLDWSSAPHRIVREACQVLAPEGHLLICGFNPYGGWSIRRMLGREQGAPHFLSAGRIQDWMKLLGLELKGAQMRFYRPPISHRKLLEKTRFMEYAGDRWWPLLAGCYLLVAKKAMLVGRQATVRELPRRPSARQPVTARWSSSCSRAGGGVVPVIRSQP